MSEEQCCSQDQQAVPPQENTATRDRLVAVININDEIVISAKRVLEVLKQHPEEDKHFAKIFGIQPTR